MLSRKEKKLSNRVVSSVRDTETEGDEMPKITFEAQDECVLTSIDGEAHGSQNELGAA